MIRRFTLCQDQRDGPWWKEDPEGHWVKYTDHIAAIEQLEDRFHYELIEQSELNDMAREE